MVIIPILQDIVSRMPPVKSPYQLVFWWRRLRFCFPPKVLGLDFTNHTWGPFQLRRWGRV